MENIVNTLDRVAQANPQKIAYDELGVTHTYQDFYEQSNALAAWIADQKLPEKSPILVYGDHQFEMVVAFTAAIKTGHPYIPVETGTGLERMDSIVATANPLLAIAIDEFPHAELANFNGQVLKDADLKQILATPQDFTVTNPVSVVRTFSTSCLLPVQPEIRRVLKSCTTTSNHTLNGSSVIHLGSRKAPVTWDNHRFHLISQTCRGYQLC